MSTSVWRIGQLLNSVQSTFVGLLRVWSIPIVLMLSIASGYTTYYGMSFFITGWIALIITVAVQSIIVICTLELASINWQANLPRFLSIGISLVVALLVSISFSYFKFYEFSQHDNRVISQHQSLEQDIARYLNDITQQSSELIARQKHKTQAAAEEASQAYVGTHPAMQGAARNTVGKGRFWNHYAEIQQHEQANLERLEQQMAALDGQRTQLRAQVQTFATRTNDSAIYERMQETFRIVQSQAEQLAAKEGLAPVKAPLLPAFTEFNQGLTPSFEMWQDLSWFALACAAMVDFFTLILSYRLESTAPGPLTQEEKELAYLGLRQFGEFNINHNDELEFSIEKTELERARRVSDWSRMFAVAFLLNRGYLRKISRNRVEFAPNLYPIIAERLNLKREAASLAQPPANDDRLKQQLDGRRHG